MHRPNRPYSAGSRTPKKNTLHPARKMGLSKGSHPQFEKAYISKGTQVKDLNIIRVSISKETLETILKDHLVDYDGNEYLVFEVAALKEPDQYGKTHTAYISKNVAKPRRGKAKKPKV